MTVLSQETIDGLNESILRDTEAAQLLERAAFRVEQGWTRGVDAENKRYGMVPPWSAAAECWCMRGAIIRATLDLGFTTLVVDPEDETYLQDATPDAASVRARAFGAAAHVILGQPADAMSNLPRIVSHWNDHTALNGPGAARKLRAGAQHIRRRIADVERGLRQQPPRLRLERTTVDGKRVLTYTNNRNGTTARVWREPGDSLPWRMSTSAVKGAPVVSRCLRFKDICETARYAAGHYPQGSC